MTEETEAPRPLAVDASTEHFPLTGLDEYLIHNHPTPVAVMWTPDLQAYERVWFTCHDRVGELLVVCGVAFYPNLGTAEAFAIVNLRGRHITVRAHRPLGPDRTTLAVGPIALEVVAPFREWRLTLGENDQGVRFDLSWFDTKRPIFRNLGAGAIVGSRPFSGVAGYDGFGHQEGWVEVDGERFEVTPTSHLGTRDHHWGTRDGVGGPALYQGFTHPVPSVFVEFPGWSVWVDHLLRNLGDPKRGSGLLQDRRYRLRFEPETDQLVGGEFDLVHKDGSVRTMTFERLGNQIAFLRCGMYGGPNGGTPDGDIWQGMKVGDGRSLVVGGESYDANDPGTRVRVGGLDQFHARFECDGEVSFGMVESYSSLTHAMAAAGRGGLSVLR
ncbi:hypothetical protein I6A60_18280 [Frankia sp. AgB1.9]|uniref:hypothetical protein n=1 Tax=unclassified Frankia TaxID=2632575 RepID=UPI00193138B0|nr:MULTISPECIES: hypothetical protein [unclassified Frankia]MBL7486817.1 hypothetical protein [Frankia sp. AgW1.1]MBL7549810.1 hypothetical protein [Frankia sp. AgB1.9]MBL7622880.1 hypothetical protein [Frankia sp. AgB1.8]